LSDYKCLSCDYYRPRDCFDPAFCGKYYWNLQYHDQLKLYGEGCGSYIERKEEDAKWLKNA